MRLFPLLVHALDELLRLCPDAASVIRDCFFQAVTESKGAARGGAEGAQAPPLAIRMLMFIS